MAEKNVVVGIDGSLQAEQALNWYIENLHNPKFRVTLVHCVEPLSAIGEGTSEEAEGLYEKMVDECKEHALHVGNKFEKLLEKNQVEGGVKAVYQGKPGEAIIETAKSEKASFIVVGSRGLSKHRKTIMGSVSDYVLHHAPCPVIVCRPNTIECVVD